MFLTAYLSTLHFSVFQPKFGKTPYTSCLRKDWKLSFANSYLSLNVLFLECDVAGSILTNITGLSQNAYRNFAFINVYMGQRIKSKKSLLYKKCSFMYYNMILQFMIYNFYKYHLLHDHDISTISQILPILEVVDLQCASQQCLCHLTNAQNLLLEYGMSIVGIVLQRYCAVLRT